MREILGSPKEVEYASRSGMSDDGTGGVGWWNVVFNYGDYKAYYEVRLNSRSARRC
jgi:hypothetical protein